MKFGVVVFPGSNCDRDTFHVLKNVMGQDVEYVWHNDRRLDEYDCIVLPGGFSYGDYLRAGAIARFAPIMEEVGDFAEGGGLVLGICNGFQILLEGGMLPGAMRKNKTLKFICKPVHIRTENVHTPFTNRLRPKQVLRVPIAHAEGNYYADPETLKRLNERGQIVFRYCDPEGDVSEESNPNGSLENIAGICNERGNVLGLMPHPERASESILGSEDGLLIFKSIVESASK
ncbi:MAG: phosphoribosylformylglycinamidine synthase subunit PurQ [bacterium]